MKPVHFEGSNLSLEPPRSMPDEDASRLPVMVSRLEMRSGEQRKAIANGADIYLHVLTREMPPVMLRTSVCATPIDVRQLTQLNGDPSEGEEDAASEDIPE